MSEKFQPEGAAQSAFPGFHPKPGDPNTVQYHLGLSKLEMFTLVAMHAGLGPDAAVDRAIEQMNALQLRCPVCLSKRMAFESSTTTDVFYVCTFAQCELFGANEALRKQEPALYREAVDAVEKSRHTES